MASLEKVWLALGLLAFAIAHIWGASLMPMSDNKQQAAVANMVKMGD